MFAELNLFHFLVLGFLVWLLGLSLMERLHRGHYDAWAVALALPALSVHFVRRDADFLKHLQVPNVCLYFVDYVLITGLLFIVFSWFQPIRVLFLGLLLIIVVCCLPTRRPHDYQHFMRLAWIPIRLFEWRLGIRKVGFLFLACYFLSFLMLSFQGSILLFAFIFTLFISSFYENTEPKEWLSSYFSLTQKIKLHLGAWTLLWLPHAFFFLIFHNELWYFAAIAWYFTALTICFCLVYKYSKWSPFRRTVSLGNIASLFILMQLIIFTAPVCILMVWYFWRKANQNLFFWNVSTS